jgi:hypothetical protein
MAVPGELGDGCTWRVRRWLYLESEEMAVPGECGRRLYLESVEKAAPGVWETAAPGERREGYLPGE